MSLNVSAITFLTEPDAEQKPVELRLAWAEPVRFKLRSAEKDPDLQDADTPSVLIEPAHRHRQLPGKRPFDTAQKPYYEETETGRPRRRRTGRGRMI